MRGHYHGAGIRGADPVQCNPGRRASELHAGADDNGFVFVSSVGACGARRVVRGACDLWWGPSVTGWEQLICAGVLGAVLGGFLVIFFGGGRKGK